MKERLLRLFGLKRYVRIDLHGSWMVMTPAEADDFLADANPIERREYKTSSVYMTPRQYAGLDEFAGF